MRSRVIDRKRKGQTNQHVQSKNMLFPSFGLLVRLVMCICESAFWPDFSLLIYFSLIVKLAIFTLKYIPGTNQY